MVGPFGGITAATVVRAIMDHSQCLGTPLALTINYVAGIALGPYHLHLKVARTNRSTQHWIFEIQQEQPDGTQACVLTGTALTAARRSTWGVSDVPMPIVRPPLEVIVPVVRSTTRPSPPMRISFFRAFGCAATSMCPQVRFL